MSYADAVTAEARLHILKELARQMDGRLNELLLRSVLDIYGIRRDRAWVATQLRWLEGHGAVELQGAGEVLVARITRDGRDHIDERAVIEGIARPSDIE